MNIAHAYAHRAAVDTAARGQITRGAGLTAVDRRLELGDPRVLRRRLAFHLGGYETGFIGARGIYRHARYL